MSCFGPVQCVNLVGVIRKTSPCFAWLRRRSSLVMLFAHQHQGRVVFPHALICDNKKNFRLCFSKAPWVSQCSDLPVALSAVCLSTQSLLWSGSGSDPRLVLLLEEAEQDPATSWNQGICFPWWCSAEAGWFLGYCQSLPGTDRFWVLLCDLHKHQLDNAGKDSRQNFTLI